MDFLKSTPTASHWNTLGLKKHHGILVSLLSLHTANSLGCGEYLDLYPLIDWLAKTGFNVLQLLPLNDSGNDPSPYNAQSSSALHPIYLTLEKLPLLSEKLRANLTSLQSTGTLRVHYNEVLQKKLSFLSEYIAETKTHFLTLPEFITFVESSDWLKPYALFKAFKYEYKNENWIYWPEEFKNISKTLFRKLCEEKNDELTFHYIIQFLCYSQLRGAHEYALSKNILLKGDIPILLSPDSADAWFYPELFDMSLAAGAPPDEFNDNWQYWGFPIYIWKSHREEHFRYWKSRLTFAANFYSLFRIDHVVGFYRIWATKRGDHPKNGSFIPEDEQFWIAQGDEILRMMIESTPMLPVAEDLGIVPDSIRNHLTSLGIAGMKVFRWEKKVDGTFIPIHEYPMLGLSTVSTHDTTTLSQWWRDEPHEAIAFANLFGISYNPILPTEDRKKILIALHDSPSLLTINLLQEYLALYPELTFDSPEDERINIPGLILSTNWTYKTRAPLEQITSHEGLLKAMQEISLEA